MKVCTDACLLGAWTSNILHRNSPKNILDIGAGTGLLSLMLAQKNEAAKIDAVEIDEQAANQSASNFQRSEWKKNLYQFNTSVQHFFPDKKYDFIICNPPFFENDLKSENENRNKALHNISLSLKELIENIERLINDDGNFAVLLPFQRTEYFEKLAAEKNYFLKEKVLVRQTEKHSFFRSMLFFSTKKEKEKLSTCIIKNENEYTQAFKELLKDYYLNL